MGRRRTEAPTPGPRKCDGKNYKAVQRVEGTSGEVKVIGVWGPTPIHSSPVAIRALSPESHPDSTPSTATYRPSP